MVTMTVLGCCFFVLGGFFWLFWGGGGPQITYFKKEDKKRTKPFSFYDIYIHAKFLYIVYLLSR